MLRKSILIFWVAFSLSYPMTLSLSISIDSNNKQFIKSSVYENINTQIVEKIRYVDVSVKSCFLYSFSTKSLHSKSTVNAKNKTYFNYVRPYIYLVNRILRC